MLGFDGREPAFIFSKQGKGGAGGIFFPIETKALPQSDLSLTKMKKELWKGARFQGLAIIAY